MEYTFLGAGAVARDLFWCIKDAFPQQDLNIRFVDETTEKTTLELGGQAYPIVKNWNFGDWRVPFFPAVGDPVGKKRMIDAALRCGLEPAPTFVHPSSLVLNGTLGKGGIIFPRCILTSDVTLKDYVTVHIASTIGHDSVIEDYVSIYPGCHVSGNVRLGTGTLLGAGTVVREGLTIADWVRFGAQSCVVENVEEPHTLHYGVPSRLRKELR